MRVALRHREEPFMPHQPIESFRRFFRPGGITEHIGTALFFGHSHTNQHPTLLIAGRQMRVIAVAEQGRQPVAKDGGQRAL